MQKIFSIISEEITKILNESRVQNIHNLKISSVLPASIYDMPELLKLTWYASQGGRNKHGYSSAMAQWFNQRSIKYAAIAVADNKLVGWAVLDPDNKPGMLFVGVYTHRNYRGHGIGAMLVKNLKKQTKKEFFHLSSKGSAAEKFYSSLGVPGDPDIDWN